MQVIPGEQGIKNFGREVQHVQDAGTIGSCFHGKKRNLMAAIRIVPMSTSFGNNIQRMLKFNDRIFRKFKYTRRIDVDRKDKEGFRLRIRLNYIALNKVLQDSTCWCKKKEPLRK